MGVGAFPRLLGGGWWLDWAGGRVVQVRHQVTCVRGLQGGEAGEDVVEGVSDGVVERGLGARLTTKEVVAVGVEGGVAVADAVCANEGGREDREA